MKRVRRIIEIDEELCDGCGECIPSCAEGAIQIVDGKAKLVSDIYCDGLGACLGACPKGALRIIEREAEDFDEEAVQKHIEEAAICPSAKVEQFSIREERSEHPKLTSQLSHWPIQIKLIPASAPFLRYADIVVAADCTAFTYANFHQDFIKDKVLMIGCPKFDDVMEYVNRFGEIFTKNSIKSVTVVIMEVPCCSAMAGILKEAISISGKEIPLNLVVISTKGEILRQVPVGS
ncbi:MAG: 4Fe-4S ferredoxin [Nitrospirae bacterium]|nr:MAG: 4Fe-4S ferredoxin [Nitrospirota bacterium]